MTPVIIGPTAGGAESRPLPAGGRPKPTLKKVAERPKVRALYDYQVKLFYDLLALLDKSK